MKSKTLLLAVKLSVNFIVFHVSFGLDVLRRVSFHILLISLACTQVYWLSAYWSTGDVIYLASVAASTKAWGYLSDYLKYFAETAFDEQLIC